MSMRQQSPFSLDETKEQRREDEETVFDFVGFDAQIGDALDMYSGACGDALRGATAALERAFASGPGGAAAVKKQFNASNLVGTKLGDPDFFYAVADQGRMNLHLDLLRGGNDHHGIEALFKAFARALRMATEVDPRRAGAIPSSKGVLEQAGAN